MKLSITTPSLLFPAITIMILVFTNRFLAIANLIRSLHERYKNRESEREAVRTQVINLKIRILLIKRMLACGVISIFFCSLSIVFITFEEETVAISTFSLGLLFMLYSLILSLREIYLSTNALEIDLKDMEI